MIVLARTPGHFGVTRFHRPNLDHFTMRSEKDEITLSSWIEKVWMSDSAFVPSLLKVGCLSGAWAVVSMEDGTIAVNVLRTSIRSLEAVPPSHDHLLLLHKLGLPFCL